MTSGKRTSKRVKNDTIEAAPLPQTKPVKPTNVPQEFEESFIVRKPLGLRIHKSNLRVTYVETNSALVNKVFVGDKIAAIDGQPIENTQQLNTALSRKQPNVVAKLRHAYFSFCQYNGATVECLQLEKDIFKSTGRAIDLFTIFLKIPNDLEETQRVLKLGVRYDARERVQIANVDSSGLAFTHMRVGDVIQEVNDHPIASKAMLRHWICEAVERGQMVRFTIERLVGGDLLRDQIETPADVIEIAQKQIKEVKAKPPKPPRGVLSKVRAGRSNSKRSTRSSLKFVDKPAELEIPADHDPTKLKPCKLART